MVREDLYCNEFSCGIVHEWNLKPDTPRVMPMIAPILQLGPAFPPSLSNRATMPVNGERAAGGFVTLAVYKRHCAEVPKLCLQARLGELAGAVVSSRQASIEEHAEHV